MVECKMLYMSLLLILLAGQKTAGRSSKWLKYS